MRILILQKKVLKKNSKSDSFYKDKVFSEQVNYAKGDPENPMNRHEIIKKASLLLGDRASDIVNYVYD